MAKKTKYCMNYRAGRHLNDGKSPSNMHCSACYEEVKERYNLIKEEGGQIEGLRGARALAGGSFQSNNKGDNERNLRAFFHYVMPHITTSEAEIYIKEISENKYPRN